MKILWVALTLAVTLSSTLVAQGDPVTTERPWYVAVSRYGKWLSLAAATGLIAGAAVYDSDARDKNQALTNFCEPDPLQCQTVGSGNERRYVSDTAEELFQESARFEKKSRSFLIGGQFAIVAAGTMFLVDLLHGDDGPKNIPFTSFELYSTPNELGLSVRF